MFEQAYLSAESKVPAIVARLQAGTEINKHDVAHLLGLTDEGETQYLFAAARSAREHCFGNKVFLYGFLYFSTYCRNDCHFCQYRKTNSSLRRYRKTFLEILGAARKMARSGVHLIDLTMGEDPLMAAGGQKEETRFADIVLSLQQQLDIPLMISPGLMESSSLTRLGEKGVHWYACYQETHNRDHYRTLRAGQSFDERLRAKRDAKWAGMLVEEGLLLGCGESCDSIAESLLFMRDEGYDQVRAMTYVPKEGVTTVASDGDGSLRECLTIAIMRLLMPDRLIPASLDVDGLEGLSARLAAGANVVTSIVPADEGLAGVANNSLDIEESRRSLAHVEPLLKNNGLVVASLQDYRDWLINRRQLNSQTDEVASCV